MKSEETQTTSTETTAPKSNQTTSHIKPESKSEPMTQVQADNVLTREQIPNLGFRIALTVGAIATLLLFVAFYYGIINV
jgi:hypothetical protein